MDRDPKGESVIHVVVADSTRVHSQLLADAVKRDRRIHVVGSVSTTRELLELVAKSAIDIALVSSNIEANLLADFQYCTRSAPSVPAHVL